MKKYLLLYSLLLLSFGAQAQTIGDLVNQMFSSGQLGAMAKLIEGFAYLGGIGLGLKGIFKISAWNESKGREAKLTTGLMYIFASSLLLGLPSLIAMGGYTLTGQELNNQFSSQAGQYGGQY